LLFQITYVQICIGWLPTDWEMYILGERCNVSPSIKYKDEHLWTDEDYLPLNWQAQSHYSKRTLVEICGKVFTSEFKQLKTVCIFQLTKNKCEKLYLQNKSAGWNGSGFHHLKRRKIETDCLHYNWGSEQCAQSNS